MVTKVEHLGPTPACQPQKIKEVTLQVEGAETGMWLQTRYLQPHCMALGNLLSNAVTATGHVTL